MLNWSEKKSSHPSLSIRTFLQWPSWLLASPHCLFCSSASMTAIRCLRLFRQYTYSFSGCFQNKGEIYFLQRQLLSFSSSTFYQGMPHVPLPPGYLLQAGRKETPCTYLGIRKNIFLPLCFFFFCFQNNNQLVWNLLGLDELQDWTQAGCHKLQSLK